ncbi:hypothetical protein SAMN00017477_0866 [Peptoniphilus asaccharolyticus DSM 20463]|uniref:Tail fiber protein n=1 Tax=Peptoniphilus asaccharolyticus DSM 20463 TaxID=573058 RepID=A0A1W1UYR3_PEPAS|nr:pyocin knob domain-containing protein [Peptoniphilus asaccharolyticus]MBL7575360.1 hypothetical protein [Peptoniphilus asaccharolyticus]SMB86238.1 hypothetical protein SAMN00017477_0866 [Peptoniphilus asaccharolyticus DSM 20463]
MKEMYKGKVNSPATLLVETIDSSVTSIKVADGSVFPEGPNVVVIGTDGNAETIKYDSINGNILVGCVRGFQGKASVWDKDTIIARNFTEYDLDALQENILELNNNKIDKVQGQGLISDAEKNKLINIEDGAEKNKVNSVNKKVGDVVLKLSDLENDKNFKTESEIQSMINNSTKLKKEVVASLPSTGKDDVIYLLKNKNDTNNFYTEYMWINGKWELIGDTKVDLTDYAKKSDIKTKLSEMESDKEHRVVTDTEKSTWNNKEDKIVGKGLSTNDYTDSDKAKVDAIPSNPKYTDTITYVVDNLTSTDTEKALSANQGKELKRLIDNKQNKINIVNDLTTGGNSNVLSAEQGKELKRLIDTKPDNDTTYSVATTSKDGLLSSADKTKINSLPSNFVNMAEGDKDLNNITKVGFYYVSSPTANKPPTSNSYIALIVTNTTSFAGSYVQQIAISEDKDEHKIFLRKKYSSSWGEWKVIGADGTVETARLRDNDGVCYKYGKVVNLVVRGGTKYSLLNDKIPEGFRPIRGITIAMPSSRGTAGVDISADGDINVIGDYDRIGFSCTYMTE